MNEAWAIPVGPALAVATGKALFASLLLGVAAILGVAVALMVRRKMLGGSSDSNPTGLTLGELRALRDRGELSVEEFERARDIVVRQHQSASRGGAARGRGEPGPNGR